MNFAIPGFQTPETPNQDQRITAKLDGTIVWDVVEVGDERSLPAFEISVAQDHGANQIRRIVIDREQISFLNVANPIGQRVVRAVIPATSIAIGPGTYRLQAIRDHLSLAEKWVTIEPSVVNEEQLLKQRFGDCPVELKSDTDPTNTLL